MNNGMVMVMVLYGVYWIGDAGCWVGTVGPVVMMVIIMTIIIMVNGGGHLASTAALSRLSALVLASASASASASALSRLQASSS